MIRLYTACDIFLVTFPARALRSEIQNLEIQYLHVHPDGLIVEGAGSLIQHLQGLCL